MVSQSQQWVLVRADTRCFVAAKPVDKSLGCYVWLPSASDKNDTSVTEKIGLLQSVENRFLAIAHVMCMYVMYMYAKYDVHVTRQGKRKSRG